MSFGLEALTRQQASNKKRRRARMAGQQGIARTEQGFDEGKGYWQPQYDYGQNVLRDFQEWGKDGDITSDPSYEWRRSQGQQGVENSAAARGGALSGNALRAVSDYNQQSASQEYQNEFNRWMQKLGMGERATGAMSDLASTQGAMSGDMRMRLGQQDFQNFMAIQDQGRQDQQRQNDTISGWFKNIFGGGMGGGS